MKFLRALSRLLTFVLLLSVSGLLSATPIVSKSTSSPLLLTASHHPIHPELFYLPEATTPASIAEVVTLPASEWTPIAGGSTYFGSDQHSGRWVKLLVRKTGDAADDWILSVDWPLLRDLEWYLVLQEDASVVSQGHFRHWQIPADSPDRFPFNISLRLGSDATYSVYLRVTGTEKVLVPVTLRSEAAFAAHQLQRNLFLGLFYGVLLAMFSYNLSLWVFTRHRSYAAYCLYVLTMGGYTLLINGAGVALDIRHDWLFEYGYRIFVPLGFLGAVWFIRQFLNLHRRGVFFNRSSQLGLYAWILLIALCPFLPASVTMPVIDLFGFINCIYGLSISAYLWYRGDASAKYLTISWLVLIITTFILMFSLTGIMAYQIELHYLQNLGVVIEVLLLSTALAERINRERIKRSEAQQLSLQLSRETAEAKESEMRAKEHALLTERKAREELAQKVTEKTRELNRAMEKLQIMNRELESLSRTDPLTDLANHRHFDSRFAEELQRATRNHTHIGFLMLDIDHFKQVNDKYGHQAGDKVIQSVAALIQRLSGRASDLPARLGGEEFCLLVSDDEPGNINRLAKMLRKRAEAEPVTWLGEKIAYTVSIGTISLVPDVNTSTQAIINRTDDALYHAKAKGRNCIVEASSLFTQSVSSA